MHRKKSAHRSRGSSTYADSKAIPATSTRAMIAGGVTRAIDGGLQEKMVWDFGC
jgi:hypothetical protein